MCGSQEKGWTKKYRPWILIYSEEFESKVAAMKREQELKTAQGRLSVRNLISKK